jgi:acyl-CoA thioester hydrolase
MSPFFFKYPIQIRYGDLDPQWHLNNAHTVILIEQSRTAYLRKLELWDGQDFFNLGLIVADIHVAYLAPVALEQHVQIGVRVAKIGNKSLTMEYLMEDQDTLQPLARAETIMVAFDYHTHQSIQVPDDWRQKIRDFEKMNEILPESK